MTTTLPYSIYNRLIDLLQPDAIQVKMDDVFRALPKINRFNGQTRVPYSVARHSIACVNAAIREYDIKDTTLLLTVLFHDAPEAYTGDIGNPLKHLLGSKIYELEKVLMRKFLDLLGFNSIDRRAVWKFNETLHEIDTRMCATESSVLTDLNVLPDVALFDEHYVQPYNWNTDEYVFKALYRNLTYTRNLKKGGLR